MRRAGSGLEQQLVGSGELARPQDLGVLRQLVQVLDAYLGDHYGQRAGEEGST